MKNIQNLKSLCRKAAFKARAEAHVAGHDNKANAQLYNYLKTQDSNLVHIKGVSRSIIDLIVSWVEKRHLRVVLNTFMTMFLMRFLPTNFLWIKPQKT